MSTQLNDSLAASKTPTQSALNGAKTISPLAAVAAPLNLLSMLRVEETELQRKSPESCRPRPERSLVPLSLSDAGRDHASATRAWHGKISRRPACHTRVHGANRAGGRRT